VKKILVFLIAVIVFQYMTKQRQIENLNNELKISKKKVDSLDYELFVTSNQLNRYEIALEKMKENDSTCSLLFEVIMESEDE
jgi:hypothetical protein